MLFAWRRIGHMLPPRARHKHAQQDAAMPVQEELDLLLHELHHHSSSPVLRMSGAQVEVFAEPAQFYQFLLDGCRRARRRVVLSSLYLGNGPMCLDLVSALSASLAARPELQARVLLDCQRGCRGGGAGRSSSRHLLTPAAHQFGRRCQVALYHTPLLRGLLKWLLPHRFSEIVGLQHMKVYIFDDDLLISGANLNDDYFRHRQDRYVVFRQAAPLADFYTQLVAVVARFSFQLAGDGALQMDPSWPVHPYRGDQAKYLQLVRTELLQLLASWRRRQLPAAADADTWVMPTVNLAPAGVLLDDRICRRLLAGDLLGGNTYLATGYLNLTEDHVTAMTGGRPRHIDVLCAHPTANGFLGSGGLSAYLPAGYTHLLQQFWRAVRHRSLIAVHEYQRPGWTFHSKGLWCHALNEEMPSATVIGSSNLGYRSSQLDLESQVVIVTRHPGLRQALVDERRRLYSYASPVDASTFVQPDRFVPYWVRLVSRFMRRFF